MDIHTKSFMFWVLMCDVVSKRAALHYDSTTDTEGPGKSLDSLSLRPFYFRPLLQWTPSDGKSGEVFRIENIAESCMELHRGLLGLWPLKYWQRHHFNILVKLDFLVLRGRMMALDEDCLEATMALAIDFITADVRKVGFPVEFKCLPFKPLSSIVKIRQYSMVYASTIGAKDSWGPIQMVSLTACIPQQPTGVMQ